MLIYNALSHKEIGDPDTDRFGRENILTAYLSYRYETLGLFLFPHLLKEGLIIFLPSKGQEKYGLVETICVLNEGRNLLDKVSSTLIKAPSFRENNHYIQECSGSIC